jgi:hypothetical protein
MGRGAHLTMDKTWKAFERRVAQRTGGERIPVSDRRTPLDVKHPYLGIECKYRKKISKFIKDAMAQATKGSGEDLIPTVILGEYNSSEMLALVRLPDLLNLLAAAIGDPSPPILVGEGEDDFDAPLNYGGTDPE